MKEATYSIAKKGYATAFTEPEVPPDYALVFRNRFINAAGGAEKRQGVVARATVSGVPNLTGIHELVLKSGTTKEFVSGDGVIWRWDDPSWTQVHTVSSTNKLRSVQMGDRLIFTNGADRRFYTEDGTTFSELEAIVIEGTTGGATSGTKLEDSSVSDWNTGTDVAVNDLVFNASVSAYAVITAVSASAVTHTTIGPTATGIGVATSAQSAGDDYRIIDLVAMNIIPTESGLIEDNTGLAGPGTTTTVIGVSGVTFSDTEIKVGDFVRNTTRAAITKVTSVSANINVIEVTAQVTGDSLVFLKSAMPISTFDHVHYGRCYSIDARDERKVRISASNDPTDMTSDTGTLDSITFNYGDLQGQGDTLLALGTFQRMLVMAGKQNTYAYDGLDPIGTVLDFSPVSTFPQGIVTPDGIASTGNDLAFVTSDGLQSFALYTDQSTLRRGNISEPIRPTLREEIDKNPSSRISITHYPRRSWLILKVGSQMYIYNYTTGIRDKNKSLLEDVGSWATFDGVFAQQNEYFVTRDGKLLCAGAGGRVYEFDQDTYDDAGNDITTTYQTGWLTLEEPRNTVRHKKGVAIKPMFSLTGNANYTITAEAGFDVASLEKITVGVSGGATPIGTAVIGTARIGGSSVTNVKHPLRWKGEVVRLTIANSNQIGPDIIDKFTLYANVWGRK